MFVRVLKLSLRLTFKHQVFQPTMSSDKKLSLFFVIPYSLSLSCVLALLIHRVIYEYTNNKIVTSEEWRILTCVYTLISVNVLNIVLFSMEFKRLTWNAKLTIIILVSTFALLVVLVICFHVGWVIQNSGYGSWKLVPIRQWTTLLGYHLVSATLILVISISWKLYKREIQAIVANENQPLPPPAVQPQPVLPDHFVVQIGAHRHGQGGGGLRRIK